MHDQGLSLGEVNFFVVIRIRVVCGQVRVDMDFDRLSSGGSIIIMSPNAVKKEVKKEVETSEKIWGYVAGEGEVENMGNSPRGPPKRAQNVFKNNFFQKHFFHNFWDLFLGSQGLFTSIFEFPFSRNVSPYFFRRFDLFPHFLLHGTAFYLLQGLVNILLRCSCVT